MKLDNFIGMMTGYFDNKEQFMEMKEAGKSFPYAQHINTVCNDKIKNIIVSVVFLVLIIGIMFINIFTKDNEISISERRKLEQFPKLTLTTLLDKSFFEKFDKYTTDQFTYRDNLRKLKVETELNIFKKKDYNNLYEYNGYIINQEYPLNEKSIENISNKVKQIANQYLTENNNVYFTIVPDKNYFVNKDNLKLDYNKMEDMLKADLTFAEYIKINDLLELSDYYKTDTHWKQENILKIAEKIANQMNANISKDYETIKITDFKGVYSGQFPISSENDEIKVLTNDTLKRCKVYNYETKEYSGIYNLKKINSLDKYDVYLSGATPMLTIENPDYNGTKELIVFRDSYGSSLIPLLVTGYSKVTVVDTRYISPKLLNQYIEFKDQDVLFMYSTLIINNSTTLK